MTFCLIWHPIVLCTAVCSTCILHCTDTRSFVSLPLIDLLLIHLLTQSACLHSSCIIIHLLIFTVLMIVSTTNSIFGQGAGIVALTNVQCSGTEARLIDCLSTQSSSSCYASQTAGAQCYATTSKSQIITCILLLQSCRLQYWRSKTLWR